MKYSISFIKALHYHLALTSLSGLSRHIQQPYQIILQSRPCNLYLIIYIAMEKLHDFCFLIISYFITYHEFTFILMSTAWK